MVPNERRRRVVGRPSVAVPFGSRPTGRVVDGVDERLAHRSVLEEAVEVRAEGVSDRGALGADRPTDGGQRASVAHVNFVTRNGPARAGERPLARHLPGYCFHALVGRERRRHGQPSDAVDDPPIPGSLDVGVFDAVAEQLVAATDSDDRAVERGECRVEAGVAEREQVVDRILGARDDDCVDAVERRREGQIRDADARNPGQRFEVGGVGDSREATGRRGTS